MLQFLRTIVASNPSVGSGPISLGQMTPLDFVFGMQRADTAAATIDDGSSGPGRQTHSRIPVATPGVSASRTGPNDLELPRKSGLHPTVNDQVVSVVPSLITAKDRYFESMPHEAVDDVLDGWKPDLLE